MKHICTIHAQRLVDLKCSQIHLTGSITGKEACHLLISHRNQLLCNPLQQHQQKICVLYYPEQTYGDHNLFQDLAQFGLISSSSKIFTQTATIEDIRQGIAFTLSARLITDWNPVGKWLIHKNQRNFLDMDDESDTFQAVKFEIRLTDGRDSVEVWAHGGELKLYPITPHDLVLKSDELIHFKENPNAVIYFQTNPHHRFFYLPKIRVGTLMSISRQLPDFSPFKDYAELCSYWKQQYGYVLPETSTGIVYFNVAFTNTASPCIIYTYPSCCVFLEPPLPLETSRKMSLSVVRQFWSYLEPILSCFPGQTTPNPWLIDSFSRIPLQEQFAEDLEKEIKNKALLRSEKQIHGISKYFRQPSIDRFMWKEKKKQNQEKKSKLQKTSGTQRAKNTTITQYFSAQNPNVKIRRTANKVTFNPV
ncbi:uncharacterized protein LOC130690554 [Daphnia carinata]|uniref:uncharacterized protein LOC130690554 n=1 Tax=Daphnia carinata TaxID=120202 RepID=UPI00257D98F2|nr:uncharacterized protein LOC130690554 [Daphnia carinata]